ncbi:MAG: hypothetical protein HON90_17400, partial [Halobacteriovoraceae bacterium]|nr:hypothetical protein [Halobacteriovoraceae bacterium]
HYDFYQLDDKFNSKSQDVFVTFLTSKLMSIAAFDQEGDHFNIPYRITDNDLILGFIGLYEYENKRQAFIEQVDTISVVTQQGREVTVEKTPVQKFSFMPGMLMTESFYPISIRNIQTNKLEPAIYIDNTVISTDQVYLKTPTDGKISSPIRSSFFVPKNCQTKNPVISKNGGHMFSFLCLEKNKFKMNYINLLKN